MIFAILVLTTAVLVMPCGIWLGMFIAGTRAIEWRLRCHDVAKNRRDFAARSLISQGWTPPADFGERS